MRLSDKNVTQFYRFLGGQKCDMHISVSVNVFRQSCLSQGEIWNADKQNRVQSEQRGAVQRGHGQWLTVGK
jgi:hypothetical protein